LRGRSLLFIDGDLVVRDGALVETTGRPNLVQALTLRVLTPAGSDPFNTGYGFDAAAVFSAGTGVRETRQLITLHLVRTLDGDQRVREVREVRDGPPSDPGRRRWPIKVTVITSDGEAVPLELRIGG